LVTTLTNPGDALTVAMELASVIASNGPLAVWATKQVIRESGDWPVDEIPQRQAEWGTRIAASDDAKEGALAFVEKRAPRWRGR
jgi:enoyl-CoA hydratase